MAVPVNVTNWIEPLTKGDRAVLAQAITLCESHLKEHRKLADEILAKLPKKTMSSFRIGFSGVPGVGKSTFIDVYGKSLIEAGKRVAVLAVDPSSERTGGSILGDKTRMTELSGNQNAFVRPSPSRGHLGGVGLATQESIALVEAAGFDSVLVETVGVGQSETVVSSMVDLFVFLALPGAGDELQGIKKGILELADIVVVNKCDGDFMAKARVAKQQMLSALKILRPQSFPQILLCSALENVGIGEFSKEVERKQKEFEKSGEFEKRRKIQQQAWFRRRFEKELYALVYQDDDSRGLWCSLEEKVNQGLCSPVEAAAKMLQHINIGGES